MCTTVRHNGREIHPQPAQPKDYGLGPWSQVLVSFLLFFNTWGVLNAFGVFQAFYNDQNMFDASETSISWIGSTQSCLVLTGGIIAGPMYDRGYTRSLLLLGGLGVAMGHILLGSCTTYWQALLAQGILVGLGGGCLYVPALATLPSYFDVRLGLATGIAAAGNSIGGIIYPIMFTQLLPRLGFPWSAQILGFTALATLSVAALMLRCRSQSNSQRAIIDWTAFSDIEFMSFSAASLLGFVGLYVTFYYLPLFAQNSISVEPSLALYIVAITNAGSIIGRIIPTWVSDQIGPLNILTPCALICAIVVFTIGTVESTAGIIAISLMFGIVSGVFIALPPVVFVRLTLDPTMVGTRIGMGYAISSLGMLAGGPGAGALLAAGVPSNQWKNVWIYGGSSAAASFCVLVYVRFLRVGWSVCSKV